DNIAVNKNRLRNLIDGIIERGYHKRVSFEAPMRADNINAEILDRLKAANFTLITYGLETASEKLMEEMKKGETVAEVVHGINLAAERGFIVGTTLIFGFPNETWKDRWDAIKLVFKLPLDSVRFNILTPYPGTPVYAELMERGEIHIKKDWENFSVQYMWAGNDLPYVPAGTNRYGLMFTTMAANLAYYLRPAGIRKLLTKRIAGGNVVVLPKGWIRTEYAWRMVRVGLYLMRRAAFVLLMLLLTAPAKWLGDKVRSLATAHSSPRIRE
ncbi:MAG: radical SAM protein, partial [Magnetospirillum sp.]